MARGGPQVFSNLGRGLNTQASPYELEAGESPDCMNVRGTLRGAVKKREGMLDMSSGVNFASQPRKIAVYRQGATTRLIALGSKLQVLEPGGAPGPAHTPVTTSPYSWSSALGQPIGSQGPLFLMSDADKLYYDGGSFSNWTAASGTIPTGRMMCAHQNRLFVADVSSLPDSRTAIVFSEIGDYRTWPVQNIVKFDPFQQDRITALCSLGTYLMVFKRDGIWRVYDADSGANNKITSQAGTVFRDSVVATDQGCFFLDPDRGVMVTDGSNTRVVSDAILPELRNLPLDDEATFNVAAAYWEGSYWLSVPTAMGAPSQLFEYDLQDKVWWRHDCAAYDLQVAPFGQSADPLLVRDALIGAVPGPLLERLGVAESPATYRLMQLMRPKSAQDVLAGQDPKPVAFRWRSAPATLDGNSHVSKRVAQLRVDSIGQARVSKLVNFSPAPDTLGDLDGAGGSEPGSWGIDRPGTWGVPRGSYIWGGAGSIVESRFHSLGVARELQLQVDGLSASDFELHSYALLVGPRPRRD